MYNPPQGLFSDMCNIDVELSVLLHGLFTASGGELYLIIDSNRQARIISDNSPLLSIIGLFFASNDVFGSTPQVVRYLVNPSVFGC